MAAGTDFSPPFTVLEGGYNKDNASITKDEICENSDDLKKMTNGKPPRHLSVVRHSIDSATITGAVDLVRKSVVCEVNYLKLMLKLLVVYLWFVRNFMFSFVLNFC